MILHIDMDAFFASVEQTDFPDLAGTPLVVGGQSGRGVVAAASYEARRYGIHSAMPIFMARQRCPHLVIVRPRKRRYGEVSRSIMAILGRYSPVVEQVSIDEAYLDATGCRRLFGPADAMAEAIKSEIRETTSLTCSIGIAPLKFLAKVASDLHKPDGLTVIGPDQVTDFIAALPMLGKTLPDGRLTVCGSVAGKAPASDRRRCLGADPGCHAPATAAVCRNRRGDPPMG